MFYVFSKWLGIFILFFQFVNMDVFAKRNDKSVKSVNKKTHSAVILIDNSEYDINDKYIAATTSLEIFLYRKIAPIVVVGKHLLVNIINHLGVIKSRFKFGDYFYKELFNDMVLFDENWLIFQSSTQNSLLLIPKFFLEYFFDVKFNCVDFGLRSCLFHQDYLVDSRKFDTEFFDLEKIDFDKMDSWLQKSDVDIKDNESFLHYGTLYDALQDLCKKRKLLKKGGGYCKNIENVLMECGFDVKKSKFRRISFKNLFSINEKDFKYGFNYELESQRISNLLTKSETGWMLYLFGHSGRYYSEENIQFPSNDYICSLPSTYFITLLHNICLKNINYLCIQGCFLGGVLRREIELFSKMHFNELLKSNVTIPTFVIFSSTDAVSAGSGIYKLEGEECRDWAYKYKCALMSRELKHSVFNKVQTLCSFPMLGDSFFRNQKIDEAITSAMVGYDVFKGEPFLFLCNWPLILKPCENENKFYPFNDDRVSCILESYQKNGKIEVCGRDVCFLNSESLNVLKLSKSVPFLISNIPGSVKHQINKIDAKEINCEIKEFVKKLFVNESIQIACSKEFIIKNLKLSSNCQRYKNIYSKQFFDNDEKIYYIHIEFEDCFKNKIYKLGYMCDSVLGNFTSWTEYFYREFSISDKE